MFFLFNDQFLIPIVGLKIRSLIKKLNFNVSSKMFELKIVRKPERYSGFSKEGKNLHVLSKWIKN